jgi:penicillin-insensitive murein endopeptidase
VLVPLFLLALASPACGGLPAPAAPPLPATAATQPAAAPLTAAPLPAPPPPEAVDEAHDDEPDDDVEDDDATTAEPAEPSQLDDAELAERVAKDPASLGSMSIGRPSAGLLVNGVQMGPSPRWTLTDPARAWGTEESVRELSRCIDVVHERFPGSPPIAIGHLSARGGGHLSPHRSHQSGRDVDVGYYLDGSTRWFTRVGAKNLDRARTWALVKAAITGGGVELVLVDRSIQKLLKEHALAEGEDRAWLDQVFEHGGTGKRAIVRHAKGHATHLHIRFTSPRAQALGRRAEPLLVQAGRLPRRPAKAAASPLERRFVEHRARSGDTLGSLARRYGTTVEAIQAANGLRGTRIEARRTYRIPLLSHPR